MTHTQKGRTPTINDTVQQKPVEENRLTQIKKTKKFLTNSDKSIFNLTWEVKDVNQQSRNDSPQEQNSARSHSHKHHHHHRHHHHHHRSKSPSVPDEAIPEEPITFYYPYAYPPMAGYRPPPPPAETIKLERHPRTTSKTVITQSEKSLNLLPERTKLKIEHYYVDSPKQSQKLIDDLRRKGYVETAIETPISSSDKKKK